MTALGTLNGGATSSAYGINNSGQIVGQSESGEGGVHAFLSSGGGMIDLGTLGGYNSYAWRINDSGQIIGTADPSGGGGGHGFLYSGGRMTHPRTLGGP